MEPDAAAKVGEEGERALTGASLDRLIALDPDLALTRIGNGTMDDLVRLKLLGVEDVTDLKSKAEGAAARKAAKAAAATSVDGVLGSTVDVGLSEIREAQKTIAGDLRSALEAGDDAAFDQAARNAEALVRFHGTLTGETPEQTEAKVEDLRERLDQLREQRDEGVVLVADETGERQKPDRSNEFVANKIARGFIEQNLKESRETFVERAQEEGLDPDVAGIFHDLMTSRVDPFSDEGRALRERARKVFREKGIPITGKRVLDIAERARGSDFDTFAAALGDKFGLLVPERVKKIAEQEAISRVVGSGTLGRGFSGQRLGAISRSTIGKIYPRNSRAVRQRYDEAVRSPVWSKVETASPKKLNDNFVRSELKRPLRKPDEAPPHPPFDTRFPASTATLSPGKGKFVRVFPKDGREVGRWLMRLEDFQRLCKLPNKKKALKDAFALPKEPHFVTRFEPKEPVRVAIGTVSRHPKWGRGRGLQFQILGDPKRRWFAKPEKIK